VDLSQRVYAQAVVDAGAFEVTDRVHDQPFLVTVNGHLDGGDRLKQRCYEIAAPNEGVAAMTAIERFVAENERLN
jgi:hypothetical protein